MEETGCGHDSSSAVVLRPDIRFYPTEEELVSFYLKNKIIKGNKIRDDMIHRVIPQLNVYDFNPWDLPQYAGEVCRTDPEQWFFYVPRQKKEANGGRPSRLTNSGYWKSTGSPSLVYSSSSDNSNIKVTGIKKTMVFYCGRAPTGKKTKWLMNEYKVFKDDYDKDDINSFKSTRHKSDQLMEEVSLCRIYIKSKCLRVFDRRPIPGLNNILRREPAGHHAYSENDQELCSSYLD